VSEGDRGDHLGTSAKTRRTWPRILQVVALMVLAAICAESVAAYDETTGRPLELALGILFFAPLYGGPAVLIRETARRARLGWPAMLPMAAAFGLLEAGVIDQSLFSTDYRGIEAWEEWRRGTLVEPLGLSAYLAQTFVVGHVIYSLCAPIAIVEALRPADAHEPWLGRRGLVVVAVLYLAVAAVVLGDHLANEPSHASAGQVVGALVVAAGLVAGGVVLGRRAPRPGRAGAPRLWVVLAVSFAAASLHGAVEATWLGVAQAAAILALGAVLLARASRGSGWGLEHVAAVAAGALLSLAALAFTYEPLIGEVPAARKYAHNAAMLTLIAAVGALAIRRARRGAAASGPARRTWPSWGRSGSPAGCASTAGSSRPTRPDGQLGGPTPQAGLSRRRRRREGARGPRRVARC
jgi:hypothetical protein